MANLRIHLFESRYRWLIFKEDGQMIRSYIFVLFIALVDCTDRAAFAEDWQGASGAISTSDWRGIAPLRSTRLDVKNKLGMVPSGKNHDHLKIKGYNVHIRYTTKRCDKDTSNEWDVPVGTVYLIDVLPKIRVSLSTLNIDLGQFRVSEVKDVANAKIYTDKERGFEFEYYEKSDSIVRISYFPGDKYQYLRCSK